MASALRSARERRAPAYSRAALRAADERKGACRGARSQQRDRTMHTKKLEKGGLIQTKLVRRGGGTHKICSLAVERGGAYYCRRRRCERAGVPGGIHCLSGTIRTSKCIRPADLPRRSRSSGSSTTRGISGARADACADPLVRQRIRRIPDSQLRAEPGQTLEEIEISFEIGSEAPGVRADWPSDIHFYLNDTLLGVWTSPGDSGEGRGGLTPSWWTVNQYGWLKMIRVTDAGPYIDGQRLSGRDA